MAKRSQIIVLTARLYRLVIITTYRKVNHFEQIWTCHSSSIIDQDFCLLDPKGMDDRTSNTSNVTSRRANFQRAVANRDRCCFMTATTESEACHIIPHAKGDQVRSRRPIVPFTTLIPDKVPKEPRRLQGRSRRSALGKYQRYAQWDPA